MKINVILKKKWIKSNWLSGLLFLIVFIGLCIYYNYEETFLQPPQSIHIWRQTNSLSITQAYYQYNLPFSQPEIYNQIGDGGINGKAAGEFPIIYYTMAQVWKIIGKSEWSFRIFQLVILFSGLFLLFRMLTPLVGNAYRAGFISLLVFTSPMVVFYGPNFIPDAPALAFTFIAWFFLFQFVNTQKYYTLWFSSLFFLLAFLLKILTATSFIALGAWVIFEILFLKPEKRLFNFKFIHYIPFILCLVPTILWYKYVYQYTHVHGIDYSLNTILPIWKLNPEQINKIVESVRLIFFKEYFFPILQYASFLIWIFMLFNIRKLPLFSRYLLIVMPFSMICIILLWFRVLEGHDYYLISQIQVMVIVWAIFFMYLKEKKFWVHPAFYILMVACISFLANDARDRNSIRYQGWMNEWYKTNFEALTEIEPYFKKWNIQQDDRVISIPDYSLTASLYYMNRKGNTEYGSDFSKEEIFRQRISQGAKYLIINDTTILNQPIIQKFLHTFVGQYRNIKVYCLKPVNK